MVFMRVGHTTMKDILERYPDERYPGQFKVAVPCTVVLVQHRADSAIRRKTGIHCRDNCVIGCLYITAFSNVPNRDTRSRFVSPLIYMTQKLYPSLSLQCPPPQFRIPRGLSSKLKLLLFINYFCLKTQLTTERIQPLSISVYDFQTQTNPPPSHP